MPIKGRLTPVTYVVSAGTMATPVRAVVNVVVSPYSAPVLSVTAGVKRFGPGTSNRRTLFMRHTGKGRVICLRMFKEPTSSKNSQIPPNKL